MVFRFCLIILLFPFLSQSQTITSIAGTGMAGNTGDGGAATAANIGFPLSGILDKFGNFYYCTGLDGCYVRKISPGGIITSVAGDGSCSYGGDGTSATSAKLNTPQGIAFDSNGDLYIADNGNNRIRKVSITTGIITTFAGTGIAGFGGDGGSATAAKLSNPLDVSFDKSGNLFIADANNYRIRKVNTLGIISTIAGNGTLGIGGENGPATNGSMYPWAICNDRLGNLYVSDDNTGSTRVLKINATGYLTKVAGDPTSFLYNGDNIPATNARLSPTKIAADPHGNLFICDNVNSRIRMVDIFGTIHTVAGNGVAGHGGDMASATLAMLNYPQGIALDTCGNLYIADSRNYRIRKVTYPRCNYLEAESSPLLSTLLSIYPNPTNDILHIDNLQTPATYQLLNMLGAAVQHGSLHKGSNSLAIQQLPAGVYMLEVSGEDGQRNVSKVIKE